MVSLKIVGVCLRRVCLAQRLLFKQKLEGSYELLRTPRHKQHVVSLVQAGLPHRAVFLFVRHEDDRNVRVFSPDV